MSRPLVHGRRSQRTTTGVEYPITRKKSVAVATNSGHWNNSTIDTKEGYNDDDDDNDAHPLPAPPPPVHHHDHVESQDEPQSLQLANNTRTNTRTNTRNRIDDDDYNNYPLDQKHFQQPDEKDQTDDLSDIPPPLPSKKTFYTDHKDIKRNSNFFKPSTSSTLTSTSTPTFIEDFMARHPKIARHRRRFAALLFTITTLFLLLVVLLAVLLTRKHDGSNGNNGIIGGNEWGDGTTATTEELKEHNKGISPPPINHSNAPGWTSQGQGEGTFYGK
ncbi:hypothetical protein BGX23_005322 [Mortierella sp. AD031]|nr:hypothetical protein BGX23_005322 [Mortierella sp. AD031]